MKCRGAVLVVFLCVLIVPAKSRAQGSNHRDFQDRVLDLLFRSDIESKPYYIKMVLRFYDDTSQIALVVYPGGDSELVRSTLDGMNASKLFQFIATIHAEHPNAQPVEVAAAVKVRTTRSPVQYRTLEPALNALKTIRVSPFLNTRVGVDEVSLYDFWFDSGQESVHYRILGDPILHDQQDNLARWMAGFRATCKSLAPRRS
jgi:hypothetical protein